MKMKTALLSLKETVSPYLIFWEEWVVNENCNLSPEEIETINHHIANGFETTLLDKFMSQDRIEELEKISVKLIIAQRVFKEWVIVKFLFTIIEMAKEYGYDAFLNTPISKLNISGEIRTIFKSFKVYSLQQLFIIYKAEDFGRAWLFNSITGFLVTVKKSQPLHT
jgi:hypothetical protein